MVVPVSIAICMAVFYLKVQRQIVNQGVRTGATATICRHSADAPKC